MSIKYLTGEIKWHKNKELDKYGKRTLDLYMDDENWEKYEKMGLGLKTRYGDDGRKFVTFSRKAKMYISGNEVDAGPWTVLDNKDEPFTGDVGNGSVVTVKLDVYPVKLTGGMGHRVEGVRVEELVEFNKREPDEVIDAPF